MFLLNLINDPITAVAIIVGFIFVGLPIHEYAHGWMANRCGDPTAKMEGRLTLNPIDHIDPMGLISFLLIGFGWGKPVPINPRYFHNKKDELKVAIAGIAANLLVALILAIPIRIATAKGIIVSSSIGLELINYIVYVNIILATFNILPIPPLDGSHFVEYFLDEEQSAKFFYYGQYLLIGFVLLGLLTNFNIFSLLMEPLIRVLSAIIIGA